jgi:hypothetical protein
MEDIHVVGLGAASTLGADVIPQEDLREVIDG